MTAVLEVSGLTKRFARDDTGTIALRDFNLSIEEGTFVTNLGRSGCGESTIIFATIVALTIVDTILNH